MTIGEWLDQIADSDSTTEEDGHLMQTYLRRSGRYPRAQVACGIVYPYGHGRPTSIQAMAKLLLGVKA